MLVPGIEAESFRREKEFGAYFRSYSSPSLRKFPKCGGKLIEVMGCLVEVSKLLGGFEAMSVYLKRFDFPIQS
jgi:hypothetical protein